MLKQFAQRGDLISFHLCLKDGSAEVYALSLNSIDFRLSMILFGRC